MEKLYVIVASQDFERANHRCFWENIANLSSDKVVVVNIPADYVVSVLRGKKERIKDAKKGVKKISDNLSVVRPLFFLRPEVTPKIWYRGIAKRFWKCIKTACPDLCNREVRVLIYNAQWVRILYNTQKNMKIAYYLFDEVRYNGDNNTINKKRYLFDEFACKKSDVVLTMTKSLTQSRLVYQDNIITFGNGAEVTKNVKDVDKIKNSVAFIGNFRNWIDEELLEGLIKKRPDKRFIFVGPVEDDMKAFFTRLLNENTNTFYYGLADKKSMPIIYRMFDCVLIPYKNNEFMKNTRPIKIVESILSGTPVVTIPMSGYDENSFIRFAKTVEEFSEQIDYVVNNKIDLTSVEYNQFVKENTWENKAREIIERML